MKRMTVFTTVVCQFSPPQSDRALARLEPGFDLGMLVDGVIVEDGVDQFAGRYGALDGVEEADESLVGVALHAAAVHRRRRAC